MPAFRNKLFPAALVLLHSLNLMYCTKRDNRTEPSIQFTKIPPFGQGRSDKLEAIEGRAMGVNPGEQIVLYARGGNLWWVQPLTTYPFTPVQADSVWKSETHPGSTYAALLVGPGYVPFPTCKELPREGGPVLAVQVVEGQAPPPSSPTKALHFAGYEWQVRSDRISPSASPNDYDTSNAWTDASKHLHLKIAKKGQEWTSAEVMLTRPLGYGSYRFAMEDLTHLERAVVFSISTLGSRGEMDIEISRWGEVLTRNGQFVIQPYQIPANSVQFELPPGAATFMLHWAPGRVLARAYRGATSRWDSTPVRDHTFTSGVPPAGTACVHINLYVSGRPARAPEGDNEVVVEAFEFLP